VGSRDFKPERFLGSWDPTFLPVNNDLRSSIVQAFGLAPDDDYVYHAIASVTLTQVQAAIDHGDANGMHAWYRDEAGIQVRLLPAIIRHRRGLMMSNLHSYHRRNQ
jgi:hypothetical protein